MNEPKPLRMFVSELKIQLDVIDQELTDIRNRGTTDAWGTKIRGEEMTRYEQLNKRRRQIVNRIIEHEP